VVAGQSYTFTPTTANGGGGPLAFSITNQPAWANFDRTSGQLSGIPSPSSVGTFANIQISVTEGQSTATLPAFAITVVAPLTVSGTPPTSAIVGSPYSFLPSASAPSGSGLTFSVQNRPAWASFNSATGELSGTPTQTGSFANIVISASDGLQSRSLPAFTITVSSPVANGPPTISGHPATGVTAGSLYSFTPSASDPAGKRLTFSIQNLPAWASFNTANGALSGTPAPSQAGTYSNIVISASDGAQSASLPPFAIKVVAPLSISGTPATRATAGKSYAFQPTTNAPSGTALTYSIQNRPVWATFSASAGTLSGTPNASQTGAYGSIVISVSDGVQTVTLPAFAIQVGAQLTISGNPPTQAAVGKAYAFQPTTNAPSGTALTYSIQNKPVWAAFSTSTGALTGAPASSQVGTYANIAISASDGTQTAALAGFSVTVANPANTAPTISGNPPTSVNAGSAYSFMPSTTDPSGQTLTFAIQNKPAWASFNTANGALTGTPAAASVGTYANIAISVSDGTASAALPPFSISVNQFSNGTATLNWTAVNQNTNGTALTSLGGYRVHYGTSANNMTTVVTLANPSVTTYLVTNLSSGTWYFGITAYASNGTESALSNVGSKTIP